MTSLRLDPENAAASIANRCRTIGQCIAYIRATAERYDGLKAFDAELEKHGVKAYVDSITAKPGQEGG